jgi:glucarate dehydratase
VSVAVLTFGDAVRFASAIGDIDNDYLEDPVFGLDGLRRVRERVNVPIATNTVVVNFEQLAANVLRRGADVVLLDTTFWGSIRACVKAAAVCETFQLGVAVHSSGELGIQLATMLHLGAVLPNLGYAADAHYHHLLDDVIAGGKLRYADGRIPVPTGPPPVATRPSRACAPRPLQVLTSPLITPPRRRVHR